MARTIKEIADGMKVDFVMNENLRTAFGVSGYNSEDDESGMVTCYNNNFAAVCVETCLIYIVAACAAAVEHLMDWFKEDVDNAIANERYGSNGWFVNIVKNFQYDGETDFGLDEATGTYAIVSDSVKVVTHASCQDSGYGVKIKVAKSGSDGLGQLNDEEEGALLAYINRLKPAGIPVTIVNRAADTLAMKMSVYYDPIVFNLQNATDKVKEVIRAYLSDIDFNGEFITMRMVDRLQAVPGIDIMEVNEVYARHAGYNYEPIENNARHTPESGYMVLADDDDQLLEINMIANV